MGLLDNPEDMALLNMGLGLLSAGGPSRAPVSIGQALGSAGQSAMATYQMARQQNLENAMRTQHMDMQKMQMDAMRRQLATREALGRALAGQSGQASPPSAALAAGAAVGDVGPTVGNAARMATMPQAAAAPSMADQMLAAARQAGDYDAFQEALKLKMEERKLAPKFATEPRTVMGPDGRPMLVQMAEDGTVRPIQGGYAPAEKLNFQNTGATTFGLDPYTGRPVSQIRNTLSPDAAASNSLGYSRLNFDKSQANKPQFKDGYWVTPPQAGQMTGQVIATPIAAPAKGSPLATQQASARVIPLLDKADSLLDGSTHSYLGAGADVIAQAVGGSTKGAQAAAQLKALEGAIMMAQPRMEGPQSDKDVALYRQMAGQIGDSTVPIATRKAALQTIRQLHAMYAGGNPAAASQPAGGAKFLGFE
ncbi:MAG: hypothetical protein KGP14_04025 [Betaproteobacteria bacterium]|nr:hypothetical protein [Betaproteobacteria bacterium]